MRVLCLHGLGTNSHILESQFGPIRARLPPDWVFEFLEGEVETAPFPDVGSAYPGPYLCYYNVPTPPAVQAAVDTLLEVVAEDGPFDAVLGFSNGAALAATAIATTAERRRPHEPPLFKAALFACSITPYRLGSGPLRITLEGDAIVRATRDDQDSEKQHINNAIPSPSPAVYNIQSDPEAAGLVTELQKRKELKVGEQSGPWTTETLLGYYPPLHGQRVHIPTVHIIGEQDVDFSEQGKRLVGLCDPHTRKAIIHKGGHHFPRDVATVVKVAEAIQATFERGVLLG